MLYVGNGLMLVLVVLSLLSRRFLVTTAAMLVKIPSSSRRPATMYWEARLSIWEVPIPGPQHDKGIYSELLTGTSVPATSCKSSTPSTLQPTTGDS